MSRDASPPAGAVMARVSRLHLGWKRWVQRQLQPYGVGPKQLYVLRQLAERGSLLPSQVAELVYADRPTVSAILRTMERAGWVATRPSPEDGRRRVIVLRAAGRALLARIPPERYRAGATAVDPEACLDPDERRALHALLGRMLSCLEGEVS
jgi:DNA-binding MarR family transcriptional regulator